MAKHFWNNPRVLAVGMQTSITTPNALSGDHHVFPCEFEAPEMDLAAVPWATGMPQAGTFAPPVAGKRGGKFKIKFPLHGSQTNLSLGANVYAPHPGTLLLGTALGSAGTATNAAGWKAGGHLAQLEYDNAAVANPPGATPTVNFVNGTIAGATLAAGKFLATATDINETSPLFGWIKTVTDADPDVVALYEASANSAVAADDVLETFTAYSSASQPDPVTFKIITGVTNADIELVGCYCTGGEITLPFGDVPFVTLDFTCADAWRITGASTVLAATNGWFMIPPANSANNGRFTFGGAGTGSPTNVEAWKEIKIAWTTPIEWLGSGAGIQGYGTPAIPHPEIKVTAQFAYDGDSVTDYEPVPVTAFRNGTAYSIGWFSGKQPGKICSVFLPSLTYTKAPVCKPSGEGGTMFWEVEMAPYTATAEGTGLGSAAPANAALRLGWA